MEATKLFSLLFLVVFFSTNYYGGNSLFFLSDNAQYLIKTISGILGFGLLFSYFVLKNKAKRELINRNGVLYTEEALKSMKDMELLEADIEVAISKGNKNKKYKNTYCTYEIKEGFFVTVVMNPTRSYFRCCMNNQRIKGVRAL